MAEDSALGWTESDWKILLTHIKQKTCTPFIGSGAAVPTLPTGKAVARDWAKESGYPFSDKDNLVRVSQYIAVQHEDGLYPKLKLKEEFSTKGLPPANKNEPHQVMAELELPLYVTTNYDDFMVRALQRDTPLREPVREYCRWHEALPRRGVPKAKLVAEPTPAKPLVYHLHGNLANPNSIVLTEDDYLDFLILVSEYPRLIPPQVEAAFSTSVLLFFGYSLEDMDFRVIFRRLANFMKGFSGPKHISVQLAPTPPGRPAEPNTGKPKEPTDEEIKEALAQKAYLEKQLGGQRVKLYWGTCDEFAQTLGEKWRAYPH